MATNFIVEGCMRLYGRRLCTVDVEYLRQWFSTFHGLWPSSTDVINIVTLGFCNIMAQLFTKNLLMAPRKLLPGPLWEPRALVEKP